MEPVPAVDGQGVAAQLAVTGDTPDVRGDLVALLEDLLGVQRLVEDGAAAEQLGHSSAAGGSSVAVQTFEDALAHTLWHGWLRIVLVIHR